MRPLFLMLCIGMFFNTVSAQNTKLLKVSENSKYLETVDNEPFFWLGGTAWEMIHRLTKEEIDLYMEDRHSKGFTVIQTVVLAELDGLNTPNAYGHKPLVNNDPTKINENYFELVDYVIDKADELGMYIALLPTWGDKFNLKWGEGPIIFNGENAERFGEIVAQRYLDKNNLIWVLGGDRMPEDEMQREVIEGMAKGIQSKDTRHLITYHPAAPFLATDSVNEPWLDFDMFQSGHDRDLKEYEFVFRSREVKPLRPVIEAEPRYENSLEKFWEDGEHDWMDDSDVRTTAYWTMLAGAAGYTYGCHDILQMYTLDKEPVNKVRTGWKEALHLSGSKHMLYMKQLFTSFPWQKMENNQRLILSDNEEDQGYILASMGQDKDFILAYSPWGRAVQLDLSELGNREVKAYWFNPRSGEKLVIGNYKTTEQPTFTPWSSGRGSDFVLVILAVDSKITF
ncbi:glycoside hydrolase family 140 protein [Flammeovirga aprica]|uniref:DUF4038 domain-containing protein n=1 Tax=Flammeovirga aprica JL-4 TaxID=694437 RepID=A0A7X9RY99_9BACT|nr:glycoside hydrolase family 140 protein [Flammeovirga aprica]NME70867.1 DUF4038 domain-containing protein [Flammeovirga aprica JL-4]